MWSNHCVHVLNMSGQAGHCHGVEAGVPDSQGRHDGKDYKGFRLLNVTFTTLMPSSSTWAKCGNRKPTKPDASRQSRTDMRTHCLVL